MSMRLSLVAIGVLSCFANANTTPLDRFNSVPVTLAKIYHSSVDVTQYWQSEKLDGIRAIWNGKELVTRNGKAILAPKWFTQPLPSYPVEGELWAGRGKFHLVQQTVLDSQPSESAWQQITFMLFDLPHSADVYKTRYSELVNLVTTIDREHINYIEHKPIASEHQLLSELDAIASDDGEGLMLRKIASHYQTGRSNDLLKLKKHQDAEAIVIGYKAGSGKYQDKMGALLVKLESGQEFYIGSGFSDAQRANPPAIGAHITFRFNGYTHNGIPKFARYLRDRVE